MSRPYPLWDIPTRVFHWTVVCCVAFAWWTGEEGDYDRHQWLGYSVLVLVLARIVWGLVGSRHSRFSDFLRGPRAVKTYLRTGEGRGRGHNPLGGWSVVLLLAVLLTQAVSGMFNYDDETFQGPFYYAASVEFRDAMGAVHQWAFDALLALVALHLAAVAYYQWGRREKLIQAMIKGSAAGRQGTAKTAPGWWALGILVSFALLLWWAIGLAPQPQSLWS